jgi:Skp family chaperone for outer membrane proteins
MRAILLAFLFFSASLFGSDATTDESAYVTYKNTVEQSAKTAKETASADTEKANALADIERLKKAPAYKDMKTTADVLAKFREDIRKQPDAERFANYEWLKRMEAAAK